MSAIILLKAIPSYSKRTFKQQQQQQQQQQHILNNTDRAQLIL